MPADRATESLIRQLSQRVLSEARTVEASGAARVIVAAVAAALAATIAARYGRSCQYRKRRVATMTR